MPNAEHRPVRDRDYLRDRYGLVFKVIGDVHPPDHYLGYVKYYPDPRGDRQLHGRTYRQNNVVSKSFGLLADRPECYVYSDVLGCVITGLPHSDIAAHYSCRQALLDIYEQPEAVEWTRAGRDLLAIIRRIMELGVQAEFGVTGSFLAGCFNKASDIDLVCYGGAGYQVACELFEDTRLIKPYDGGDLNRLYTRRAKYMVGCSFDMLIKQEKRKLQGLTVSGDIHTNCEPLRIDDDRTFARVCTKEIGHLSVRATITSHEQGLATPAFYGIEVMTVLESTVDEPESLARRVTHVRSYLGAYTGAFRAGDMVHLSGKLVYTSDDDRSGFGIELTPWSAAESYLANLTTSRVDQLGHGGAT